MSPDELVDTIERMLDAELVEDARRLCTLWLSQSDSADLTRARLFSLQGDCLLANQEYLSAIESFNRALYIRRLFKLPNKQTAQVRLDDATVCFKQYKCHMGLRNFTEAKKALESVPAKHRTARISNALARLYERTGHDRTAQTYYKEVVREFPVALDALLKLSSLGAKTADLTPLLLETFPSEADWLTPYLRAENLKYTGFYVGATEIFRELTADPFFKANTDALLSLAECEYLSGNNEAALSAFGHVLSINRYQVGGMDVYSSLLYFASRKGELSGLVLKLQDSAPSSKESWIACGFYSLLLKKIPRGLALAQKALSENEWNIEASLLKAHSFFNSRRRRQACAEFSRAYQRAPYRFEVVEGLINCFNVLEETKSALMLAQNIRKNVSSNPKFSIIYANSVSSDSVDKARSFLEGVNKSHPNCLPVVYALIDIYKRSGLLIRAQEMIQATLQRCSTSTLHCQYGYVLLSLKNHREAMEHFNLSLLMDPENPDARKAVMAVEVGNFTTIVSDGEPELNDVASDSDVENYIPN